MAATLKTFLYASRCFNQGGGCTNSRPSQPSIRPVTTSCLLLQSHHLSCCCFVSNQVVFAVLVDGDVLLFLQQLLLSIFGFQEQPRMWLLDCFEREDVACWNVPSVVAGAGCMMCRPCFESPPFTILIAA